jgi:hypothetical protein
LAEALPAFVCMPLADLDGTAAVLDALFDEAFHPRCGRQAVIRLGPRCELPCWLPKSRRQRISLIGEPLDSVQNRAALRTFGLLGLSSSADFLE